MADQAVWKDIERQILDSINIVEEYKSMNVQFEGSSNRNWVECWAIDRPQGNAPSAAVCVTGHQKGRYRDMGGDGLSLNLWEFAAKFGGHGDWREARKHFAMKAGVRLPGGAEPAKASDKLEFQDSAASPFILEGWAEIKGGFTLDAILDNGGRYAAYPKAAKYGQQNVCAFPILAAPDLTNGDPCGWVIANVTGEPVTLYRGKGKEPSKVKTCSVGGSVGGLLGSYCLGKLCREAESGEREIEVVWKVEGLSDMLALHAAITAAGLQGKHVVFSNSQGTLETVKAAWADIFKDRTVYVVHDADQPGEAGSKKWASALAGKAARIKRVQLPYEIQDSHGEDLRDYLHRDKHSFSELLAIAEATPDFDIATVTPEPAPSAQSSTPLLDNVPIAEDPDHGDNPPPAAQARGRTISTENRRIWTTWSEFKAGICDTKVMEDNRSAEEALNAIGVSVIGENSDGSVSVFSQFLRKVRTIDSDRITHRKLVQLCGSIVHQYVHTGAEKMENMWNLDDIRMALSTMGGLLNLDEDASMGAGIWMTPKGRVVLVNGDHAAILTDDHKLIPQFNPRVDDGLLDFRSKRNDWVDFEEMEVLLEKAGDLAWCRDRLATCQEILVKWNWKNKQDSLLCALLIPCTYIQTLWRWRPEVALAGPTACGKSTLFSTLTDMFGKLGLPLNKPTEAALRQRIRNRAVAVLIDEFENDKNRQALLEALRISGKGGEIVRGTSDHKGITFKYRHLPWTAAIESGLLKAADRNRFIMLDLAPLPPEVHGKTLIPEGEICRKLGLDLCAIALRHWKRAVALSSKLKGADIQDAHRRVVESFSVPAAMGAVIYGKSDDGAVEILQDLMHSRFGIQRQSGGDELDLLKLILESQFPVGNGMPPMTVSDVITDASAYIMHNQTLERFGIGLTSGRPGPRSQNLEGKRFMFFNMDAVKRYLLRGTGWEQMDCEQLLLRVEGATHTQRAISGKRCWGVEVPMKDMVVSSDQCVVPLMLPDTDVVAAPSSPGQPDLLDGVPSDVSGDTQGDAWEGPISEIVPSSQGQPAGEPSEEDIRNALDFNF